MLSENVKTGLAPINDFLADFLRLILICVIIFIVFNLIKKYRDKKYFDKNSNTNSTSTTNDWWSWDFMNIQENIQNAQENNSGSDTIIVQDAINEGVKNETKISNNQEVSN